VRGDTWVINSAKTVRLEGIRHSAAADQGAVFVGKRASRKDIVAVRIRPDLASAQSVTATRYCNDRTALIPDRLKFLRNECMAQVGWMNIEVKRSL
jgi:hypothetical protein